MLTESLKAIVGQNGWTTDPDKLQPMLTEWRGIVQGQTLIAVSPANTAEVAAVVKACAAAEVGIVPQGGNTGMCAGAVPDESGSQVLLSLSRMNRIRHVDAENYSMEVEAGCILESIQNAAQQADRYFPLSLGGEGSCQIGGNLSTDAGGINVIRYGTARSQVLGLEAVLADGSIVNSLRALRKDTAGYDLKQLFIGSEGTLGIITAAVLKLYPDPGPLSTAFVALPSSADAVRLLAMLRPVLGDRIEAFELISEPALRLVEKHVSGCASPFVERADWYVLMTAASGDDDERLTDGLLQATDAGLISNALIAKNAAEVERLWKMRHSITVASKAEGRALKHDIAVPVSRLPEFLAAGDELLRQIAPDARLCAFGHVGDGNLHYNVALADPATEGSHVTDAIYDLVAEYNGSFSAEHGVGRLKRNFLPKYRSESEIALMRVLKQALDAKNILNPGKVI